MSKLWKFSVITMVLGCWVSTAAALEITCEPSNERVASLDSAILCKTGNDENIHSPEQVSDLFGGTWFKEGELTANGTNDLFSVSLTSGNWGENNVEGTWTIDSQFWTVYGIAAITMHVGHGKGNPDFFAWLVTPGKSSGTFAYQDLDGKGGGISNLFLFGSGAPTPTNILLPESGMGMLFLLGLMAVFLSRRRLAA